MAAPLKTEDVIQLTSAASKKELADKVIAPVNTKKKTPVRPAQIPELKFPETKVQVPKLEAPTFATQQFQQPLQPPQIVETKVGSQQPFPTTLQNAEVLTEAPTTEIPEMTLEEIQAQGGVPIEEYYKEEELPEMTLEEIQAQGGVPAEPIQPELSYEQFVDQESQRDDTALTGLLIENYNNLYNAKKELESATPEQRKEIESRIKQAEQNDRAYTDAYVKKALRMQEEWKNKTWGEKAAYYAEVGANIPGAVPGAVGAVGSGIKNTGMNTLKLLGALLPGVVDTDVAAEGADYLAAGFGGATNELLLLLGGWHSLLTDGTPEEKEAYLRGKVEQLKYIQDTYRGRTRSKRGEALFGPAKELDPEVSESIGLVIPTPESIIPFGAGVKAATTGAKILRKGAKAAETAAEAAETTADIGKAQKGAKVAGEAAEATTEAAGKVGRTRKIVSDLISKTGRGATKFSNWDMVYPLALSGAAYAASTGNPELAFKTLMAIPGIYLKQKAAGVIGPKLERLGEVVGKPIPPTRIGAAVKGTTKGAAAGTAAQGAISFPLIAEAETPEEAAQQLAYGTALGGLGGGIGGATSFRRPRSVVEQAAEATQQTRPEDVVGTQEPVRTEGTPLDLKPFKSAEQIRQEQGKPVTEETPTTPVEDVVETKPTEEVVETEVEPEAVETIAPEGKISRMQGRGVNPAIRVDFADDISASAYDVGSASTKSYNAKMKKMGEKVGGTRGFDQKQRYEQSRKDLAQNLYDQGLFEPTEKNKGNEVYTGIALLDAYKKSITEAVKNAEGGNFEAPSLREFILSQKSDNWVPGKALQGQEVAGAKTPAQQSAVNKLKNFLVEKGYKQEEVDALSDNEIFDLVDNWKEPTTTTQDVVEAGKKQQRPEDIVPVETQEPVETGELLTQEEREAMMRMRPFEIPEANKPATPEEIVGVKKLTKKQPAPRIKKVPTSKEQMEFDFTEAVKDLPEPEPLKKKRLRQSKEAGFVLIPDWNDIKQAGANIYDGVKTFAEWSGEMVSRFGETIKDSLQGLWDTLSSAYNRFINDETGSVGSISPIAQKFIAKPNPKYSKRASVPLENRLKGINDLALKQEESRKTNDELINKISRLEKSIAKNEKSILEKKTDASKEKLQTENVKLQKELDNARNELGNYQKLAPELIKYEDNLDKSSVALPPRWGFDGTIAEIKQKVLDSYNRIVKYIEQSPEKAKKAITFYKDMGVDLVYPTIEALHPEFFDKKTGDAVKVAKDAYKLIIEYALGSLGTAVDANYTKSTNTALADYLGLPAGYKMGLGMEAVVKAKKDIDAGGYFDVETPGVGDKARSFAGNALTESIEHFKKTYKDLPNFNDALNYLETNHAKTLGVLDKNATTLPSTGKLRDEYNKISNGKSTTDMWDMAAKGYTFGGMIFKNGKADGFKWTTRTIDGKKNTRIVKLSEPVSAKNNAKVWDIIADSLSTEKKKINTPEDLEYQQANSLEIDGKKDWDTQTWEDRKKQGFSPNDTFTIFKQENKSSNQPGGAGRTYDSAQYINGVVADLLMENGYGDFFGKDLIKALDTQQLDWAIMKQENPLPQFRKLVLFGDFAKPLSAAIKRVKAVIPKLAEKKGASLSEAEIKAYKNGATADELKGLDILLSGDETYQALATSTIPIEVLSGGSENGVKTRKLVDDLSIAGVQDPNKVATDWVAENTLDVLNKVSEDKKLGVTFNKMKPNFGGYTDFQNVYSVSPNKTLDMMGDLGVQSEALNALSKVWDQERGNAIRPLTLSERLRGGDDVHLALEIDTKGMSESQIKQLGQDLGGLVDADGVRFLSGFSPTNDSIIIGGHFYEGKDTFNNLVNTQYQQIENIVTKNGGNDFVLDEKAFPSYEKGVTEVAPDNPFLQPLQDSFDQAVNTPINDIVDWYNKGGSQEINATKGILERKIDSSEALAETFERPLTEEADKILQGLRESSGLELPTGEEPKPLGSINVEENLKEANILTEETPVNEIPDIGISSEELLNEIYPKIRGVEAEKPMTVTKGKEMYIAKKQQIHAAWLTEKISLDTMKELLSTLDDKTPSQFKPKAKNEQN